MFYAYQAEPDETQWLGTIHLIHMEDVIRVETGFFETGEENKTEKCLHVYTKWSIITIKRADAARDFRNTFNQYLYTCNYVQNFVPEKVNDNSAS